MKILIPRKNRIAYNFLIYAGIAACAAGIYFMSRWVIIGGGVAAISGAAWKYHFYRCPVCGADLFSGVRLGVLTGKYSDSCPNCGTKSEVEFK